MRILIVEDDTFKLTQLKEEVERGEWSDLEIKCAGSLQEAMDILEHNIFDGVLLDMAIPSHPGDAGAVDTYSQPVGGLDVLLYLSYSNRPESVTIITQYPTIEYDREHVPIAKICARLIDDGVNNIRSAILFSDTGHWQSSLNNFLEKLA